MRNVATLLIQLMLFSVAASCSLFPPSPPRVVAISQFPLPPPGTDAVGRVVATLAAQDNLLNLARYFDVGHDAILDANPGIDPWNPAKGTRIILPTQYLLPVEPRRGIVVNLAALRLYYYPAQEQKVITHPTGIGRENWETPAGITRVTEKIIDPAWRVPSSIRAESARQGNKLPSVVPPGPNNPLGQYALRLGIPGYLIHGTNRPYGIGMRVSHGCIQLYPEDISALFHNVPLGTPVTIINRPYLMGRIDGKPYLEAHLAPNSDLLLNKQEIIDRLIAAASESQIEKSEINWHRAIKVAQLRLGIPLPIYYGAPKIEESLAAVPLVSTGIIPKSWDLTMR